MDAFHAGKLLCHAEKSKWNLVYAFAKRGASGLRRFIGALRSTAKAALKLPQSRRFAHNRTPKCHPPT
jgi:hypothetical protein